MKTWKHFTFVAVLAVFGIILGFIGCNNGNDDPPEQPEYRSEEITFAFTNTFDSAKEIDNSCKAKIEGTLLATDWNGATNKVKTLIDDTRHNLSGVAQAVFGYQFRVSNNAVIILKKNPADGYSKYKVEEGNYQTLYLNVDALNNTDSAKPSLTENDLNSASYAMWRRNARME